MRKIKSSTRRAFHQNLFEFAQGRDQPPSITVISVHEDHTDDLDMDAFLRISPLGIAPGYSEKGTLIALALCDGENGRLIEFKPQRLYKEEDRQARDIVEDLLRNNPSGIYAFDCGTLAMSLYMDLGIRLKDGVDIPSAFPKSNRRPEDVVKHAIGSDDCLKINQNNLINVFIKPFYDLNDQNRHLELFQQAWLARFIVTLSNNQQAFDKVPKINSADLNYTCLEVIAKISNDAKRLDFLKPSQTDYVFTRRDFSANPNEITVVSHSYKTRIRNNTNMQMTVSGKLNDYTVRGLSNDFTGPIGAISSATDEIAEDDVIHMRSVGRDDLTSAERNRNLTVVKMLSNTSMFDNPWIRNVWYTHGKVAWKKWSTPITRRDTPHDLDDKNLIDLLARLNPSQREAVDCMMKTLMKERIVLIQGPPGTGKTSVISAFVSLAVQSYEQSGIWLVAQSNVAVKNIAEKLASIGFHQWRLLVSKDFHMGWHEHLYGKVDSYVIRSEEFTSAATRKKMKGVNVILCTLSMLSNSNITKFTKYVPLETMVVDEASQIEIGSYLSVFTSFSTTLRKLIFIGDNKQLPPFRQEDVPELQSIFELEHLKDNVIFLDTQYRMPPQIGNLISSSVYEGKLKSNPKHPAAKDPFTCFFLDISGNEESAKDSFKNTAECDAIIKLAQKLTNEKKNFKIITPYDGQRNLIEQTLKNYQMNWKDTCFNVDSFQGNEEDYIIISIVRSRSLGFLSSLQRTNVMLSRCKLGMYIVSSRKFLLGTAKDSLVGKFAHTFSSPKHWLTTTDLEDDDDYQL